ncbi:hypothetical protein [Isoptericola sp. NPDC057391]|uniref:hypothetical protein n=1 Tax=Isoptericola sp. NPDC057391 TaxID=3346117 RepID=UPI00362B1018
MTNNPRRPYLDFNPERQSWVLRPQAAETPATSSRRAPRLRPDSTLAPRGFSDRHGAPELDRKRLRRLLLIELLRELLEELDTRDDDSEDDQ